MGPPVRQVDGTTWRVVGVGVVMTGLVVGVGPGVVAVFFLGVSDRQRVTWAVYQ
jgi:hypothetical protein